MALLRYFKQRDGLPDPKGSLTLAIPSRAISIASREVTEATPGDKKRGPYKKYSHAGGAVSDRSLRLRSWRGSSRMLSLQKFVGKRDSLERSKLARTCKSPFFDTRNW